MYCKVCNFDIGVNHRGGGNEDDSDDWEDEDDEDGSLSGFGLGFGKTTLIMGCTLCVLLVLPGKVVHTHRTLLGVHWPHYDLCT